jgi:TetR/AcrR family transcriptional regulator, transcriptional repressor for nem operon
VRYGQEHKKRTRQRVLAAAASAIRAQGPHKVTVAGIMASAGLTHGGFYEHFDSKDDLVAETIREMFAGALSRLESFVTDAAPQQALHGYITWYLSPEHRDARQRGCPLAALSGDLTRLPAAARERAADGHGRVLARLAEVLGDAGHPEPGPLAMTVMAEMLGGLASARALGDGPSSDAALEASRAHLLGRLGLDRAA